jgi:hypothetical protein
VTEDVAPQAADLGQGLDKSSAADGSTCCLTVRLVAQANLAAVADIASIVLIIDSAWTVRVTASSQCVFVQPREYSHHQ